MNGLLNLTILLIITTAECYKILIYSPRLGFSHVQFLGRMADILVEAGYDVAVLTNDQSPGVQTNGTKLARVFYKPISLPLKAHLLHSSMLFNLSKSGWHHRGDGVALLLQMYRVMLNAHAESSEKILEDEHLLGRLRDENFDLGITEFISFGGYAIFAKIGIRNHISALATNLFEVVADSLGVNSSPSFMPVLFSRQSDIMSYTERLQNFFMYIVSFLALKTLTPSVHGRLERHFDNDFKIEDAIRRSSFAFVNSEELIDFPRLLSQKVVYVGGIAVSQTQRQLNKIKFIWKYELNDQFASNLPNVAKRSWIPQSELLAHPNVRAFISHCGQNSLTESINHGVPLICIPVFGDQLRNAKTAEKRGVGIFLDKDILTEQSFRAAIDEVLHNERYRSTAELLARMIREKPTSSRERLLRYTEFALKHGPLDNLDVASADLNVLQYYLIDLIVPILIIVILSVVFTRNFFRCSRSIKSHHKLK